MDVIKTPEMRVPVKVWRGEGVDMDERTLAQVRNLATLPFVPKHVALMPDGHVGIGSTVGSVFPTLRAIVPAAVGVDIGCGMMAQQLSLTANDLPDNLHAVRTAIEKAIPHGRTDNGGSTDRGAWGEPPPEVTVAWLHLFDGYGRFMEKHLKSGQRGRVPAFQLGTLGTGNHFFEVCLDEEDHVWLMLHSGSRGIGNKIGTYFISRAKKAMERWFVHLPDADLAYLPEGDPDYTDYVEAVGWAQEYARVNRTLMMEAAIRALGPVLPAFTSRSEPAVNCHHNYIAKEHHFGQDMWITRKGAVRARVGDLGIIPGSMGAKSFIVRGKGNPDSFSSCSHGAGRRMSRTEAKKTYTTADLEKATAGVECRKDAAVVDEIPMAYKSIDAVMKAQEDLVEIVHTLRQVVCVKG